MSDGSERVEDDELLYRRVPVNPPFYDPELDSKVTRKAFQPHKTNDSSGLSLYRAKYLSPQEVAQKGRGNQYYVAVLRARNLREHGIEIEPMPLDNDPGHAVFPGLNSANRASDEAESQQVLLAEKLCLEVLGPFQKSPPI